MLKGQDILVLLRLIDKSGEWTIRSLGGSVDLNPAGVHRALGRPRDARLVDGERPRVNHSNAEEFLLHGFKYLFPVRQGGLTRGIPTAWAAPPLNDELASDNRRPFGRRRAGACAGSQSSRSTNEFPTSPRTIPNSPNSSHCSTRSG